jgi:hypothetical protein
MGAQGHLPRLDPSRYRGEAYVLWTLPMRNRSTGWLGPSFHQSFREILLHALVREGLACRCYTLLADHFHCLWIGLHAEADQRRAVRFLRQEIAPHLLPVQLQSQSHDRVLREEDRAREAVRSTVHYLAENPVRAGLVDDPGDWPYTGALLPGYPRLPVIGEEADAHFWKLLARVREEGWPRAKGGAASDRPINRS